MKSITRLHWTGIRKYTNWSPVRRRTINCNLLVHLLKHTVLFYQPRESRLYILYKIFANSRDIIFCETESIESINSLHKAA